MFGFMKRKLLARARTDSVCDHVTFDDERVTRTMVNGQVETVRWDDLLRVAIVTTDEGPFVDDVFWLLSAEDHGCAVPSEAEGMATLLTRLQELPGFDNDAVIRAMGWTDNELFPVWTRAESEHAAAIIRWYDDDKIRCDKQRLLRAVLCLLAIGSLSFAVG